MDAAQAIADLMEVSTQVDAVVLVDERGEPLASSLPAERGAALARAATQLLELAPPANGRELTQLEAATAGGSLFVVRDGGRTLAAATPALPSSGLVLYDLRTCLRALDEPAAEEPKPKPKRRRKKADDADA